MHQTLTAAFASVNSCGAASASLLRRHAPAAGHFSPITINYSSSKPAMKPNTPSYLASSWGNLSWTRWVPLNNKHRELSHIPTQPGIYRVRPVDGQILAYIGQTGRSLRQRMRELRVFYNSSDEMPWNDPHTAAQSLWTWRDAEGCDFEVSVAPLPFHGGDEGRRHRLGQEAYLLWKYRCEHGSSTLCNHGRFHSHYSRSTNRSAGIRGGRLPEGQINPAAGPSSVPLHDIGSPNEGDWMGLHWEPPLPLQKASLTKFSEWPALYMMINPSGEVIYIGETKRLRSRMASHVKTFRDEEVRVSHVLCSDMTEHYQRLEWENDLLVPG
ncbi:GIY-YIG nuclease family protein [Methanogenium organophilum]|uniref:GIY-YIG nuclease family protein n=1 Tax=Methanogenium organophilum TaxID=2199 RepID=A0A9X9S2Z9_METOG|nr:GIY-YIG nuclease family protein [Methanogenium organophilum]WAI00555.1 GIY-YIG nuclease family protein [Methanogenium organophilum]